MNKKKVIIRNPSFTPCQELRDHLNKTNYGTTEALNILFHENTNYQNECNWLMKQALPENLENDEDFWAVLTVVFNKITLFNGQYALAEKILGHFNEIDINQLNDKAKFAAIFCHESSQLEQWSIMHVLNQFHAIKKTNETTLDTISRIVAR